MVKYEYKNTGIEWLSDIPKHWKATPIKKEFKVIPSNVDKKSSDDETEVKLCNYVDVYYNDFLDSSIDYMIATANDGEIQKFKLSVNDVLITKDSEDPYDIAVPAVITEIQDNFLCGYHLSMIRSINQKIDGKFLFWAIKDEAIASQLYREATGVTRWAIASRHIKNSTIPFPPLSEQKAIVDYLDKACKRIDSIIEIKQKQLERIEGYFKTRIIETTTKGLRNEVNLKPVKSDWIKGVPEHWKVKKIKRLTKVFRGKFTHRPRNDERLYDGDYPFIQTGSVTNAKKYINEYHQTLNEWGKSVSELFPAGTLTMTIAANIADVAILNFDACFPDSIVGFKPQYFIELEYLYYLFIALRQDFLGTAIITTQMNLNVVRIGDIEGFAPPKDEQLEIIEYLNNLSTKTENLKDKINAQITTLQTYRKSLIHECVTGKKQVWEGEIKNVN